MSGERDSLIGVKSDEEGKGEAVETHGNAKKEKSNSLSLPLVMWVVETAGVWILPKRTRYYWVESSKNRLYSL